jgi:hypothetical protein
MPALTLTNAMVAAGLILQVVLVFAMIRKHLAKAYPIFVLYLTFNVVEDLLGIFVRGLYAQNYLQFYFVVTILDDLLQIFIFWEVARNVFRPAKGLIRLPVGRLTLVGFLACAVVGASFVANVRVLNSDLSRELLVRIFLVLAILKILLFAALASFAQLLGINWKNHVLQLASGLAFFGAVSLMVELSSTHLAVGSRYRIHLVELNEFQSGAYLLTLLFWIWAFSRNEAPRKDFTPQMQEVLVTIAHSAKRTRLAVTRGSERR